MLSCDAVRPLIARAADGGGSGPELERHLASCDSCRDALAEQQRVVAMLRQREPVAVPAGFAARLSARLDEESRGGLLDIADWRIWTAGLAPLAAALVLASYLGAGVPAQDSTADLTPGTTAAAEAGFETWMAGEVSGTPASVFLQPAASADLLLETVLTGAVPTWSVGRSGDPDVR